jgi:hypothetical protein
VGFVGCEVGDSVVVINVLEVTVTVLVRLTGMGSRGLIDIDGGVDVVPVGEIVVVSSETVALLNVTDGVSIVVDRDISYYLDGQDGRDERE